MKKISILIVIFVTILLSNGFVYAKGGGSQEPGGLCAPEGYKCKYITPPYIGTVLGYWDETKIYLYTDGNIEQVGKSECYINIPADDPDAPYVGSTIFPNNPSDVKGACAIVPVDFFSCMVGPSYDVILQVVGIGKLKILGGGWFSAHAVIMPVLCE